MTGCLVLNLIAFDYPPNDDVSHKILSSLPQPVPVDFKILRLPKDI